MNICSFTSTKTTYQCEFREMEFCLKFSIEVIKNEAETTLVSFTTADAFVMTETVHDNTVRFYHAVMTEKDIEFLHSVKDALNFDLEILPDDSPDYAGYGYLNIIIRFL